MNQRCPAKQTATGIKLAGLSGVEREASELTHQLAGYMVTFLGPEGATASAEERKNRMAMIFRSVREEHGAA